MIVFRRLFLPAMLSGVLLWLAFFPVNLGILALVALAPFLTLVRAESPGRFGGVWRYLAALAGGCTFFGLAISWVRVAHPMMELFTWPAGTLYCALSWPVALYFLRRLDPLGLPFTVTLPIVWVLLEYIRTHFPTGFSFLEPLSAFQLIGFNWYALGYALHGFLPAIQAADIGGVYLISVAVASLNGAAYEWMLRSNWVRVAFAWPRRPRLQGAVWEAYRTAWASILPAVLVCYGTAALAHPPYQPGPRIAAIQGNLPQNEKMMKETLAAAERGGPMPLERTYFPLAARAARPAGAELPPDLVIWPETCFPFDWDEVAPDLAAANPDADRIRSGVATFQRQFIGKLNGLPPTHYLLGLNRLEWANLQTPRKFNSAVLFDATRTAVASYDKMHLVPFGEYVPLGAKLLRYFTPYGPDRDYSCTPGDRFTLFPVPAAEQNGREFTFGMLICYEDTDPYLARQYNPSSGRTPGADFLVNISNDGWFLDTAEHAQHLAIARFRAIEARRSLVRAVNTGISAVIDPDGRVVALPAGESWIKSQNTTGIVRAVVPIATDASLYAALGDWVPLGCFLALVGLRLWPRYGSRTMSWAAHRVRVAADVPADRKG